VGRLVGAEEGIGVGASEGKGVGEVDGFRVDRSITMLLVDVS
jgi:hypothetical protein